MSLLLSLLIASFESTSTTMATSPQTGAHASHYTSLAKSILFNLQYEQEWSSLHIHYNSPLTPYAPLPRPLISGYPRTRIYVHPDEQIELLAREKKGEKVEQKVEREWVLPSHLREKWSLKKFAECFDAVGEEPPSDDKDKAGSAKARGHDKSDETTQDDESMDNGPQSSPSGKRMLLATLSDDSTVVYYIVHDGIVKPRQN